jgi:hypothetical protein
MSNSQIVYGINSSRINITLNNDFFYLQNSTKFLLRLATAGHQNTVTGEVNTILGLLKFVTELSAAVISK